MVEFSNSTVHRRILAFYIRVCILQKFMNANSRILFCQTEAWISRIRCLMSVLSKPIIARTTIACLFLGLYTASTVLSQTAPPISTHLAWTTIACLLLKSRYQGLDTLAKAVPFPPPASRASLRSFLLSCTTFLCYVWQWRMRLTLNNNNNWIINNKFTQHKKQKKWTDQVWWALASTRPNFKWHISNYQCETRRFSQRWCPLTFDKWQMRLTLDVVRLSSQQRCQFLQ